MPAETRSMHRSSTSTVRTSSSDASQKFDCTPDVPPIYTIDLSLPPAERYVAMASDLREQMHQLTGLFDETVGAVDPLPQYQFLRRVVQLLMRRLHSHEQTEELRGISRAIGIDMYLLVSFNVLLDVFMGCSSGGARVEGRDGRRMLHFRTLDWSQEELRKAVVQLEFVEGPGGQVIGRSITYAGYVGIVTGVRFVMTEILCYK